VDPFGHHWGFVNRCRGRCGFRWMLYTPHGSNITSRSSPPRLILESRTFIFDPLRPYGCGKTLAQAHVSSRLVRALHDVGEAEYPVRTDKFRLPPYRIPWTYEEWDRFSISSGPVSIDSILTCYLQPRQIPRAFSGKRFVWQVVRWRRCVNCDARTRRVWFPLCSGLRVGILTARSPAPSSFLPCASPRNHDRYNRRFRRCGAFHLK
jgi:hypothetical protein